MKAQSGRYLGPFLAHILLGIGIVLVGAIQAHGIVAGALPDTPAARIDPNVAASPFAGVVSIDIAGGICTGTLIKDRRHVVTAAHCLDTTGGLRVAGDPNTGTGDGIIDFAPNQVTVFTNRAGNQDNSRVASALAVHPDWHGFLNVVGIPAGFGSGSLNDDVAVITLGMPMPDNVPIYNLFAGTLGLGSTLTLVGYGQSGSGSAAGYTTAATLTDKRSGRNNADVFSPQDDPIRAAIFEDFEYDFDGPVGNGPHGGPTLGNAIETIVGPGDSGGPAFVNVDGVLMLAGINTFATAPPPDGTGPAFGSIGGGMLVSAYFDFIHGIIPQPSALLLLFLGLVGLGAVARWKR
jgi:hypothetical protein